MKKIILYLFLCLLLVGCTSSKYEEKGTVDATTRIAYNIDDKAIKVSNVIIKCNDAYYGVTVNDSVNFNNKNNYFTTASGLKVMITSDKLKTGSLSTNDTFTASTMIEDGVYLYASGDETKVKEVFDNVFKTNREVYTFLNHDINPEWMKEVNITDDVISFSNGVNTIYAYQNDGSLSDGCIKGRIEPTVFMKALRGIDLPITYPEDTQDRIDYIPYGLEEYEHYTNEGYTPYSVYPSTELKYEKEMFKAIELTKTINITEKEMVNYIMLAKDDNDILSLFDMRNNHDQTLYSFSIPRGNTDVLDINSDINLSDKKDIAKDVINSDNRYHFGVLGRRDEDGSFTIYNDGKTNRIVSSGYYVDAKSTDFYRTGTYTIANSMSGKAVIPTIKLSIPLYDYGGFLADPDEITDGKESLLKKGYTERSYPSAAGDFIYAATLDGYAMHGMNVSINKYLESDMPINEAILYSYTLNNDYEYVMEGRTLAIRVFTGTVQSYEKEEGFEKGLNLNFGYLGFFENRLDYDDIMEKFVCGKGCIFTCSSAATNGCTKLVADYGTYKY